MNAYSLGLAPALTVVVLRLATTHPPFIAGHGLDTGLIMSQSLRQGLRRKEVQGATREFHIATQFDHAAATIRRIWTAGGRRSTFSGISPAGLPA